MHNNVGGGEYRGSIREDLSAFFHISCIGIAGLLAGARLNYHLNARFGQDGDDGGNQGNAAFSGIAFFGNSNNHLVYPFWARRAEPNTIDLTRERM